MKQIINRWSSDVLARVSSDELARVSSDELARVLADAAYGSVLAFHRLQYSLRDSQLAHWAAPVRFRRFVP